MFQITKCANKGRPTPLCWKDVCSNTPNSSDARRSAWRRIPGFFSAAKESKAEPMGVSRVSIPSHDTKSPARKQRQNVGSKSFRNGAPAVKAASVFSNADMGSDDPFIKD